MNGMSKKERTAILKQISRRIMPIFLSLCLVFMISGAGAESGFSQDADAIEKAADSVFMLEVYSSSRQKIAVGSGFLAFDRMTLVTNYHVIEDGAYVVAISDDSESFLVTKVCISDKKKDIAILRFDTEPGMEPLELDGESVLKRSQPVVAIGSPAGLMNTISIGNISAFYQKDGRDWIQFTAPISSGSSGGALFNDEGKIIGITTATYASAQNINMAVKAEYVIALYQKWNGSGTSSIGNTTGVSTPPAASVQTGSRPSDDNATVYVTAGGKKYHNNPNCSRMKNPIEIDLMDALQQGYEPCGKCYK